MDKRSRGIIGLISGFILCVYGTYHIFSPSVQAIWTSWLLAIGGLFGMLGGVWELRKFNKGVK